MGGIIGSGIFMNPAEVARKVTTPFLILFVWALGGLVALVAAFIWAELAALRPEVGGQYAYLRDAYHPLAAFLYGWGLLLVIQSGGMAAVAVTFARYFLELTNLRIDDWIVAVLALAALTVINCLGVRAGGTVQSLLMVLKIFAIIALIAFGLSLIVPQTNTERWHRDVRGRFWSTLIWFTDNDRRGDGAGVVCLRWLANFQLRVR